MKIVKVIKQLVMKRRVIFLNSISFVEYVIPLLFSIITLLVSILDITSRSRGSDGHHVGE